MHILSVSLCTGVIDLTVKQTDLTKKYGAIIGVFITRKQAKELITMNPGLISSHRYIRFIELARASEGLDVTLYFFADGYVNFEKKYVIGLFYDLNQNTWRTNKFPLPHVLYDRGGGIVNRSKGIIKKLNEQGIENINGQHYFDKWDLYNRLSKLEAMKPHLPITVKGETARDVVKMLNRYGEVYVKARRGSCGTGVIRIEKHGPDQFKYHYSYGSELFSGAVSKLELIKIVSYYFANHPFIIQKPIDLIKKDESIIDFRSEVQKNGKGQIFVFGTTARIGRPGSPIASNTRKDDYYPFDTFVKDTLQLHRLKALELQIRVNRFLFNVFRSVEQVYGSFGEIGIDFGLDAQGNLWLIECNSKSAKVALYNAFGHKKVRQSFRNMLQYAHFMADEKLKTIKKEGT